MPAPTSPKTAKSPSALDLFTDREQPQALFEQARAGLAADKHHILMFYGVGGQGKSLLCEKLRANLQAEQPRKAAWGWLNLEQADCREPAHGLLQLRKSFGGGVKFPAFDHAIATYWEKAYPAEDIEAALQGIIGQHEDSLSAVAENAPGWLGEAVEGGVIGLGLKAIKHLWKRRAKQQAEQAYPALCGLDQRKPWDILGDLPMYLGWDLRAHLTAKKATQAIVFIDAYEALWADKPVKAGAGSGETDAWLRRLVAESPGVLFVMAGRDKLTWDERFPRDDWGAVLGNQHLLGGLSDADADSFLCKIPVREEAIRRAIVEGAKGEALTPTPLPRGEGLNLPSPRGGGAGGEGSLPFYLDLEAKTYQKILAQGQTPQPQDFGGTYAEIIDRFLRHADKAEREILKRLSAAQAFDPELFGALAEHYRIQTLPGTYQELTGYSFVGQGSDGRCRLHGLMREHLYAELGEPERRELEQFLFDWHDARCQPASPKEVSAEHETALREAVYHRDLQDAGEALDWFWARWRVFYDAARYAAIEPLCRWALRLADERFGVGHAETAIALNNLAQLLKATNRLAEAEPLMRRALAIDEKSFGPEHPKVAIRLNNLAALLKATNRLAEAEPLMRRALAIDEKSYGPEHPEVATDLNNLAQLLQDTNRLAEAEPLMRRVVEIFEKSYGPEHPNVARALNNLAQLLQATNRLAEAGPLMRRALDIAEASYGPEHPNVAISINNLAQLLKATNRLAEAEPLMRRALDIDEASFGPAHPNVATDLNNLARLLQDTNRLAEAEPLMRRALVIVLKFTCATSHEHPGLQTIFGNYWQVLEELPLDEAAIAQRIQGLAAEAGFDDDGWQRLLARLASPDSP